MENQTEEIIDYNKLNDASSAPTPDKGHDTYSYKGWLISDNFAKRALASTGYHFVGVLMVYAAILAIFLVLGAFGLVLRLIF